MQQACQKGFKFYGGPLNGDYLEMDLGESFEMESLDYSEMSRFAPDSSSIHRYVRRLGDDKTGYAYYYDGQQLTH